MIEKAEIPARSDFDPLVGSGANSVRRIQLQNLYAARTLKVRKQSVKVNCRGTIVDDAPLPIVCRLPEDRKRAFDKPGLLSFPGRRDNAKQRCFVGRSLGRGLN